MKYHLLTMLATIIITACNNSKTKSTAATEKPKVAAAADTASHLVGMWYDEDIKTDNGEHIAYQIVTKNARTYIQVVTFTEKKFLVNDMPQIAPSASLIQKKGNRYVGVANASEAYLVDKAGDLLIYDNTGFIAKCKKLL